jgi:hypothetical protein
MAEIAVPSEETQMGQSLAPTTVAGSERAIGELMQDEGHLEMRSYKVGDAAQAYALKFSQVVVVAVVTTADSHNKESETKKEYRAYLSPECWERFQQAEEFIGWRYPTSDQRQEGYLLFCINQNRALVLASAA